MLETLHLQLSVTTSVDGSFVFAPAAAPDGQLRFTDLLQSRVANAAPNESLRGHYVPQGGNALPSALPIAAPEQLVAGYAVVDIAPNAPLLPAVADPTLADLTWPSDTPNPLLLPTEPATLPIAVTEHASEHSPAITADVPIEATGSDEPQPALHPDSTEIHPISVEQAIASDVPAVVGPSRGNGEIRHRDNRGFVSGGVVGDSATRSSGDAAQVTKPLQLTGERAPLAIPEQPIVSATRSEDIVKGLPVEAESRLENRQLPQTAMTNDAYLEKTSRLQIMVRTLDPVAVPGTVSGELTAPDRPQLTSLAVSQPAVHAALPGNVPTRADSSLSPANEVAGYVIRTPLQDPAWGERLSERVMLLAGSQQKTAEIRLSPAELGPLRVQIAIDDGAANVTFHAQHTLTREAIELALPRLRELLAENGLALGQTEVGDQGIAEGKREQHSDTGPQTGPGNIKDDDVVDEGDASIAMRGIKEVETKLVDTFA